jgi:hypothetical protein
LERKGFDKTEAKFWRKGLGKVGRFFVENNSQNFWKQKFYKISINISRKILKAKLLAKLFAKNF